MNIKPVWSRLLGCVSLGLGLILGSGCENNDSGVSNDDPGDNDVNVYVAIGDSLTSGSECNTPPYPAQLAGMLGKTVVNQGSGGEQSGDCASRAPRVLSRYKPGFMLILTGVNDIIHRQSSGSAMNNVRSIVRACKANKTVPIVATYPIPRASHAMFSGGTITLNALVRQMADEEGVPVVDLESEFGDNPDLLMPDGLHPNVVGTTLMALAFKDVLQ
ncbi:MAG: SGNH/GDSL hydrolase family protein [Lentisphaerota bacterium]